MSAYCIRVLMSLLSSYFWRCHYTSAEFISAQPPASISMHSFVWNLITMAPVLFVASQDLPRGIRQRHITECQGGGYSCSVMQMLGITAGAVWWHDVGHHSRCSVMTWFWASQQVQCDDMMLGITAGAVWWHDVGHHSRCSVMTWCWASQQV